jgi:hypothetical protein
MAATMFIAPLGVSIDPAQLPSRVGGPAGAFLVESACALATDVAATSSAAASISLRMAGSSE